MDKYIIVNKDSHQIVCKGKNSSRHYRQFIGDISKYFVVLQTTKGRAEKERDYLNQEYNKGWEIEKVEPMVFKDNREENEKRMQEYEEEIEQAKQEAVREILQEVYDTFAKKVENGLPNLLYDDFTSQVVKIIANRRGIELEKDNGQRRNI